MECIICENRIPFMDGKKINDGVLCKRCMKKVPHVFYKNISHYESDIINKLIEIGCVDEYSPTAHFGNLYIDEVHGIFSIKSGSEESRFNCLSISSVDLYATNVKCNRYNSVHCDFGFSCSFSHPKVTFKTIVKKNALCQSHRENRKEVHYELPGDYNIFVQMFNQMLDTAKRKFEEKYKPHFATKADMDLFMARTLYMLPEAYDEIDIENQKDRLLNAFSDVSNCSEIIMQSYYILLRNEGIVK